MKKLIISVDGNEIPKKALVLSDLHILKNKDSSILNQLEEFILTRKNNYDFIYVVGDIIDSTLILYNNDEINQKLFNFVEFLGQIAPTYFVIGNHDIEYFNNGVWEYDEEKFVDSFINKVNKYKNIYVLQNETKDIGDNYTVSGINPNYQYFCSDPDGNDNYLNESCYDFLNSLDKNNINTVLCHYPNLLFTLNQRKMLKNVNVCVAGHNHNGITQFMPVEFLFDSLGMKNRGIITPGMSIALNDTKFLRGVINFDQTTLVINPSIKSLSEFSGVFGVLEKFDKLFYRGVSEIEYKSKSKKM